MRKASPAEDLSAKKALARTVIDRLKQEYPDAGCTLDYDHAWQLLVSVRLAAQCTDARVNIVVQDLFAKYPDVASLAAAEPSSRAGWAAARRGISRPVCGCCVTGTTARCPPPLKSCWRCPAWAGRARTLSWAMCSASLPS